MHTLIVSNLSKTIKKALVLDNINLHMKGGSIYGFVGKNGSGKTMLFRTISGLVKPTTGEIIVNGKKLYKEISFVPNLGLIIENVGLYPEFTGIRNLEMLAKINNKIDSFRIKESIKRVGLDPEDNRTVKKYSLGMRQRIVLAQALMEYPDFILMDEPTNGIDDSGVELIRTILQQEAERGAMVAIATHSKEDVEILCDVKFKMTNGNLEEL